MSSRIAEASHRLAARKLLRCHLGRPSETVPPVHVAASHRHKPVPRKHGGLPIRRVESSQVLRENSQRHDGVSPRASWSPCTGAARSFPPASMYRRDHEASHRHVALSRKHASIPRCECWVSRRHSSVSRRHSSVSCRHSSVSRRHASISRCRDAVSPAERPMFSRPRAWSLSACARP